jgi:DNA-directed RNA polymerase specialized sigma24 family protein
MFLRVLEQMSFREIGDTLGISEASAKNLYSMGLKDIRKRIGEVTDDNAETGMAAYADGH